MDINTKERSGEISLVWMSGRECKQINKLYNILY